MVEIRKVTVDELRTKGMDLFAQHWREVGYSTTLEVNPLWPLYYAKEMGQGLLAFGAFDSQQLVAYAVAFVGKHHHCQEHYHTAGDVIFVHAEYRQKGIAERLKQEIELAAREMGAKKITWHAPPGGHFDRMLSSTKGSPYRVLEVVYERSL